jgi:acetyl esterase/lipase
MIRRRALLLTAPAAVLAACSTPSTSATTTTPEPAGPAGPQVISYGSDKRQTGELTVPGGSQPPAGFPVIILIHGGFWSSQYDRSLENEVAKGLNTRGYATWNIDYRSLGDGGGYPQTFEDVAAACDHLAELAPDHGLDLARSAIVGHSAGGTLALWAAARHRLPDNAPGAHPRLTPAAAVSQAGVDDLADAARTGLGGFAVVQLLGGPPDTLPEVYAHTSPIQLVPLGIPSLAVAGSLDTTVPPAQSTTFAQRAQAAGDRATVTIVDGETHFDCLSTASKIFAATADWLDSTV